MANLVENADQIIENIRTMLGYARGGKSERKFHDKRIKNGKLFVVLKEASGLAFAPSKFAGYSLNTVKHEDQLDDRDGRKTNAVIANLLGPAIDEEDSGYVEVDRAFLSYCKHYGITPSKHHRPRRYWIVQLAQHLGENSPITETAEFPPGYLDAIDDIGSDTPRQSSRTTLSYARDPKVRASVMARASGKCEYCGADGFICSDGSIYLESHHVISLANDGADRTTNVIALCPNHHREAHFGKNAHKLDKEMTVRLQQLNADSVPK